MATDTRSFPTRERWIENGFKPCKAKGCTLLIAPSLLPEGLCTTHERQRRRERANNASKNPKTRAAR